MGFFVSESFIGHVEMTSFANCRTVDDNLHDCKIIQFTKGDLQKQHISKNHTKKTQSPKMTEKERSQSARIRW